MAQNVAAHACNGCGDKFGIGDVNFGTKHMSDLMRTQAEWAPAILNADRLRVTNARVLNRANTRQNTYGALVQGFAIRDRNWESADGTVKAALSKWVDNLNKQFGIEGQREKYTPAQLQQLSTDLKAAAECLSKQSATLVQRGEMTNSDNNYFQQIIQGMQSYAGNLDKLHEAVKAGPDICEVILDWAPAQH